jgi:hypothetical protein
MNKTISLVGVLLAVAMLSAVLVVLPIQEVDARSSIKIKQKQENKCSGNEVCSKSSTITIIGPRPCSRCG